MSDVFGQPEGGATPLTAEETRDLKLSYIASRGELNVAEQENIARGQDWATRRRRRELLSEKFVCDLHRRMLGDVWKWAGRLRSSERNLGIPHWEIPVAIKELLADTKTWITTEAYAPDEIAVRFHHRLVQIHPFPNGNGRHARLMADLLITELGGKPFSWGRGGLRDHGELRRRYIVALQAADHHDIQPLLTFSRS